MRDARVVLLSDDTLLAGTLGWLLRSMGASVTLVERSAVIAREGVMDAAPAALADEPDVLLLDLAGMVAADAEREVERMAKAAATSAVRMIALSPLPRAEAAPRLLERGASDVVHTPVDVRELLARVEAQLRLREEFRQARSRLSTAEMELERARHESESRRRLVDILHEVAGDFSSDELSHLVVRRVARALNVSHCALILARSGEARGTVVAALENPAVRNLEVSLDRYPDVRAALDGGEPVFTRTGAGAGDTGTSAAREEWASEVVSGPLVRSAMALPFELDGQLAGVFYLRTVDDEVPLRPDDRELATTVVKVAVAAIRRARDAEATRADQARLQTLALTDPLTLVLNRRALMERLTEELERARRYELNLTVLMLDLDHFKAVNDTYGHLAGDEVLRGVARLLQREARSVDLVARYGGEEFVVVLPETSMEGAVSFAERVGQRAAEEVHSPGAQAGVDGAVLRVTVSIGVASFPQVQAANATELLGRADDALYRAKQRGRNRVCI